MKSVGYVDTDMAASESKPTDPAGTSRDAITSMSCPHTATSNTRVSMKSGSARIANRSFCSTAAGAGAGAGAGAAGAVATAATALRSFFWIRFRSAFFAAATNTDFRFGESALPPTCRYLHLLPRRHLPIWWLRQTSRLPLPEPPPLLPPLEPPPPEPPPPVCNSRHH